MKKIADFFSKWAFALFLCVLCVIELFTLGCSIYTAVTNPFIGCIGVVGALCPIMLFGYWAYIEIRD